MRLMQTLRNGIKLGKPVWREAATLIVGTKSASATNPGVEYLVTKRSPQSPLFPNGICFPGGAVSPADNNRDWLDFFSNIGIDLSSLSFLSPEAHRPPIYRETEGLIFSKEISLRLAAIRETFEECGFLICKSLQDPTRSFMDSSNIEELGRWQKRVKEEPNDFLTLCQELSLFPNLWSLTEWSNWLAPTFIPSKHRFDVMFYVAILQEAPKVIIDSKEVADCFTASAGRILDGGWMLPPPQLYELSRMRGIPDIGTLETLAKLRQVKGLDRTFPVSMNAKDGKVHTLPGDDLYPQDPNLEVHGEINLDSTLSQLKESTKNHNRLHLNPKEKNWNPEVIVNMRPRYGQLYSLS